jgi:hypothetical protein
MKHQCFANSFQNKRLPDSHEIQSLKDKLDSTVNKRLLTVPAKNVQSLENMVKKEIKFFELEGIRGLNPQLVNDYLSTIAPFSIEPERAFSAANQICSNIRSSLNNNTIDWLHFLRAHFIWTGSVGD